MYRREFLKAAGTTILAALAVPGAVVRATKRERPNILFMMADDHATNAIKSYSAHLSGVVHTGNIDRLGREGARLDACLCTNSICTPSRATILTGKYSHKNGVYTLRDKFDASQPHVAKLLCGAGYSTAMIGKWHLKTEPTGFDYYNVLPGQGKYHNPHLKEIGRWEGDDFEKAQGSQHAGHVTDVIGGLALDWLRKRNTEKPFFMMCHFKAPHGKWEYAKRFENLYDGIEIPEPETLWEDRKHRSEATRNRGSSISGRHSHSMVKRMADAEWPTGPFEPKGMQDKERTKAVYQKYLKDYLRCAAGVNENVGRILDYLDQEGLADNTIVVYTSDQGQFLGEHDFHDKRWMYEESLRMPFLIRYPKEIPENSVNNDLILNTDFAPTFLDYAGVSIPPDMQGRSFRTNVAGETPKDWRGSAYYRYWLHLASHDNPSHYGVRTKDYKLIFFYGLPLDANGAKPQKSTPGWELYDLRKDPDETRNVYDDPAYADAAKELKRELLRLKTELGDEDEKYPELMQIRANHWEQERPQKMVWPLGRGKPR